MIETFRSFHGAEGFKVVRRADQRIEFSRHLWLKDRILIEIDEEVEISDENGTNPYTYTEVTLSLTLNSFRHPFAASRPSIDLIRVDSAITDHFISTLGHAVVGEARK